MKRLLCTVLAGTMITALAAPAMAADLPMGDQDPYASAPVPAERFYWTGFYFGGTLGYGWGQRDATGGATGSFDLDSAGVNVGVHAGYNHMMAPNFLIGVEGDISYSDQSKRGTPGGIATRASSNWISTYRARAGYVMDNVLLYGTGGLAVADRKWSGGGSDSTVDFGWTLGAGVETMLTSNLTARAEYLYADFGKETFNFGGATVRSDFDEHITRVGLSYKF